VGFTAYSYDGNLYSNSGSSWAMASPQTEGADRVHSAIAARHHDRIAAGMGNPISYTDIDHYDLLQAYQRCTAVTDGIIPYAVQEGEAMISIRQFTILTTIFTFATSILVIPSPLAQVVGQDAWIAAIVGIAFNLLYIMIYIGLLKRNPRQSLIQMIDSIVGKWLGKVISLSYIFLFFSLTVYFIRYIGSFVSATILPETPTDVIYVSFTLVVIVAVRLGVETFARAAELFFPFIVVFLAITMLLLLPEIKLDRIEPMLESDILPLVSAGIQISTLQEHMCLLMLLAFIQQPKRIPQSILTGTVIGSVLLIGLTALCILVLGNDYTARNLFPSYVLAKKISIADFFERIEVLLTLVWFLAVFIKTTVSFYSTAYGMSQMLGMKSWKPITLPIGLLVVVFAKEVYANVTAYLVFIPKVWFSYGLFAFLVLPLLLLLLSLFRTRQA